MSGPAQERTTARVEHTQVDKMGVARYEVYLEWFAQGRQALLRSCGTSLEQLEQAGVCLRPADTSLRYVDPALHDDQLTIVTALQSLARDRLCFTYRVTRDDDEQLVAEGATEHSCHSPAGRARKLPAEVVRLLAELTPQP